MERKIIKQNITTVGSDLEGSIPEAIKTLEKLQHQYKAEKYRDGSFRWVDLSLSWERYAYEDGEGYALYLVGHRYETESEMKTREEKEKAEKDQAEKWQRQQYEELKKKFG